MNSFRRAWNCHRLRTEHNCSPEQLWVQGMLQSANSHHTATVEVFSEPPSLAVRLEDALQHFQLDIQQFHTVPGPEVPQYAYSIDVATINQLKTVVADITDYKKQYTQVTRFLEARN
jgi:hypothetical protein